MTEFTISTLRSVYVDNEAFEYPFGTYNPNQGGIYIHPTSTGWQVIPNIIWEHFCSPKEFYEMTIKYEAVQVTGITCTLFNMIPIQTTLAIQGTTTFSAFNNTVYLMGYNDDLYETPPFPWANNKTWMTDEVFYTNGWNPAYKEGRYVSQGEWCENQSIGKPWWGRNQLFPNDVAGSTNCNDQNAPMCPKKSQSGKYQCSIQKLPHYCWTQGTLQNIANKNTDFEEEDVGWLNFTTLDMTGVFWDPLNRPDRIMELRPGKNAITFRWEQHPADSNTWFNLDYIANLWPYPRASANKFDWPANLEIFQAGLNDPTLENWRPGLDFNPTINKPTTSGTNHGFFDYIMRPNMYPEIPNWRKIPVVPTNWWMKEIQQSNIFNDLLCNADGEKIQTDDGTPNAMFWRTIIKAMFWPGTEYEQYKYPPTQWFVKTIPIFDDTGDLIPVHCQVWMKLDLHLIGKPRRSAIYAPTWGPWQWNAIYGVDGLNQYNLSGIRGRSGGARRTNIHSNDPPFNITKIPVYLQSSTSTTPITPTRPPNTPGTNVVVSESNVKGAYFKFSNISLGTTTLAGTRTTQVFKTPLAAIPPLEEQQKEEDNE
uniref:VP1 n=1 Tax=Leopard lizard parvovirus TaxID=2969587 RepID=A0A9N7ABB9_9VIRU|nr:TPA_asm: VP1 [Leopard lizard parvovirus]